MLKLKLQYVGHLIQRADSFEKTLMLGKIAGRRRRGWQMMRWLDGITDSTTLVWASSRSWWWTEKPGVLQSLGSQRVRHDWTTELNQWVFFFPKKGLIIFEGWIDCLLDKELMGMGREWAPLQVKDIQYGGWACRNVRGPPKLACSILSLFVIDKDLEHFYIT